MRVSNIPELRELTVNASVANNVPCSVMRVIGRHARVLSQTEGITPWQKRQGVNIRKKLEGVRFDFELGIKLAGWQTVDAELTPEDELMLKKYPLPDGQTGHCQVYYGDLFSIGIDGIKDKLTARAVCADEDEKITLQSFMEALNGLSEMIINAGEMMGKRIAQRCKYLASNPPRDFHDAIQLLWLVNLAISTSDTVWCVVPGRLDRILGEFYVNDIASGAITRKHALLLIEEFYLLINYTYHRGLAYSIMVGGKDESGRDTTNELSYLCFEALRRTKLAYPTVGLCWNEQTPQSLFDLAIELVCDGYSTPAFFGDDIIIDGLKSICALPADTCNYINSACVEITPCGGSNIWVASPYFSTCKILLDEIDAQVQSGNEAKDFDEFLKRYLDRIALAVKSAVDEQNEFRREREQFGLKPLQSVFTFDCIERARDIDNGGARYNQIECSFVGLANLVDSLYVLREEIFTSGKKTLAEFKVLLDSNFSLSQEDAARLRNAYPKYGHGNDDIDSLLGKIVKAFEDECSRHKVYPADSEFLPGAFCWEMHTRLGCECGATPDGRLAGTPFADGAGPAQGREIFGPTASILSTTAWSHSAMLGGVAYNMKFNKSVLKTQADRDKLKALVLTYLNRRGFETQINVLDRDVLQKALANPHDYEDLVVRIGGYTDYFTRLIPEMQQELIQRMEFDNV